MEETISGTRIFSTMSADEIVEIDQPPLTSPTDTDEPENGIELFFEYMYAKEKNFRLIQIYCIRNHDLLRGLAQNLSGPAIELICAKTFAKNGISEKFVEIFFTIFLPTYFKRSYNWFTQRLITLSTYAYWEQSQSLFQCLYNDLDVPTAILFDYAQPLHGIRLGKFIEMTEQFVTKPAVFRHHMKLMSYLFTKCNSRYFGFIFTSLKESAQACRYDKLYGTILLNFLLRPFIFTGFFHTVNRLVEYHGSCCKIACDLILEYSLNQAPDKENIQRTYHIFKFCRPKLFAI